MIDVSKYITMARMHFQYNITVQYSRINSKY